MPLPGVRAQASAGVEPIAPGCAPHMPLAAPPPTTNQDSIPLSREEEEKQ